MFLVLTEINSYSEITVLNLTVKLNPLSDIEKCSKYFSRSLFYSTPKEHMFWNPIYFVFAFSLLLSSFVALKFFQLKERRFNSAQT